MRKTLYPYIALLVAVACVRLPDGGKSVAEPGEITFRAAMTKAVQVSSLESFGVVAVRDSGLLWQEEAVLEEDEYLTGRMWTEDERGAAFYASNADIGFGAGGPYIDYDRSVSDMDVVVASSAAPEWGRPNGLVFDHILTRLGRVSFDVPSGLSATLVSAVLLSPGVAGRWSFASGWSGVAAGADEALAEGVNDLWLIPGDYRIDAVYDLSGDGWTTRCSGSVDVSLAAGMLNAVTFTVGETLSASVIILPQAWTLDEDNYSYSTEVTVAGDGQLVWQAGSYASLDVGAFRLFTAFGTDAEASFRIETPEGAVWYAMLETLTGGQDAFRFVDGEGNLSVTAFGAVGERCTLRIRQTDPYPSVTNSARLTFVVRAGGRNIPVTALVDDLGHDWTIIQNANN